MLLHIWINKDAPFTVNGTPHLKVFERKFSLFALAMADVLIVNMWMHDIGRYNAANYSLLKAVFELNLRLFKTWCELAHQVSCAAPSW